MKSRRVTEDWKVAESNAERQAEAATDNQRAAVEILGAEEAERTKRRSL
jgi:hypothetical protein